MEMENIGKRRPSLTQAGLKPPGEQTQIAQAVRYDQVTKRLARRRFWKKTRLVMQTALLTFALVLMFVLFHHLYRRGPYLHRDTSAVTRH